MKFNCIGGINVLKVKVLLAVGLFVCATLSVTDASTYSASGLDNDEIPSLNYLPDADKAALDVSEENELPFQEELDMEAVVVYPPTELNEEPITYTVGKGDSLSRIAKEYNISLDALMSWNGLTGDLIHPGDVFVVNGDPEDVKVVQFEPYAGEPSENLVAATNVVAVTPPAPAPPKSQKANKQTPSAVAPKTKVSQNTAPVSGGTEMSVTATAYTAYCNGCSGTTAYGIDLRANPNQKVIAVDPRIIPLGTRVWVEGYGEAIAGDTGGAIKGNKIDVFLASHDSAIAWGVKKVKIKVLN